MPNVCLSIIKRIPILGSKVIALSRLSLLFILWNSITSQAQCTSGCGQTINFSSSTPSTITATANGQTICLIGTGTFTGTFDFMSRTGVNLCVGPNVTIGSSVNLNGLGSDTRLTNYGTWNRTLPSLQNTNLRYVNNYGRINTGGFDINSGGVFNNYGTLNVSGTLRPQSGGIFTNHAGANATVSEVFNMSSFTSVGTLTVTGNFTSQNTGVITMLQGPTTVGGHFVVDNATVTVTGAYLQINGDYTQRNSGIVRGGSTLPTCGGINVNGVSNLNGGTFGDGNTHLGMCDNTGSTNATTGFNNMSGGATTTNGNLRCGCILSLPVSLVLFTAQATEQNVHIRWATATESNNDYFVIERSGDAKTFTEIMRVEGQGNSTGIMQYTAEDREPLPGTSYYRLKQRDYNGQTTYSKIVAVQRPETMTLRIYPNPAEKNLIQVYLTGDFSKEQHVTITIQDGLGQLCVAQQFRFLPQNAYVIEPALKLPSGVYLLKAIMEKSSLQGKLIIK